MISKMEKLCEENSLSNNRLAVMTVVMHLCIVNPRHHVLSCVIWIYDVNIFCLFIAFVYISHFTTLFFINYIVL